MTSLPLKAPLSKTAPSEGVTDAGNIRVGGGYRLPAEIIDNGSIRVGGGYRLPSA